jgi:uncharacterized protein (DUF58 family)
MLTERGSGMLIAGLGCYLASRFFGIPELQIAAVAALVLLAAAFVFIRVTSTSLEADRLVTPARLFFDAEANVRVTVRNVGRLPTATMELRDSVPLVLARGGRVTLPPLDAGQRASLEYSIRGRQRGRFPIGPLTVKLHDPFRLLARTRELPGAVDVVVYPPVWQLPGGLPLGGAAATAGDGRPRPRPSGDDLANVRDYIRGDDLRAVHWPSTAHRGKLMVRQAEAPEEARAVVLLDARDSRHRGFGPTASIEAAVAAASSAIYELASRGRGVVLMDRPFVTPPRPRPWEGWLEELAELQPRKVDFRPTLRQLAHGVAGDGALVAIVTVPDASELRDLVRAGRGFTTRVAVLVDTVSFGGRGGAPPSDTAPTAARLQAAGWRVTVLRSGDRLDRRWLELLVQHPTRRVG